MDSVKLLKEEIEREELRIERTRQELAKLEANAKTASQEQRKRAEAVCRVVSSDVFTLTLNRHIHYCKILRLQLVILMMLRVLDLREVATSSLSLMKWMRTWRLSCHNSEVTWRAFRRMGTN
jgi:hypothetical protein